MSRTSRANTTKVLDLIEQGLLDPLTVIKACFDHMSEDDVTQMAEANEFIEVDEENDNDD